MDPPTLKELSVQQCIRIAGQIRDFGGANYSLLEPIFARANARQLAGYEERHPEISQHSDRLWQPLVAKEFPQALQVPHHATRSWRARYEELQDEKDRQLGAARDRLLRNQKQAQRARAGTKISITEPVRRTAAPVFRSPVMQQLAKQTRRAPGAPPPFASSASVLGKREPQGYAAPPSKSHHSAHSTQAPKHYSHSTHSTATQYSAGTHKRSPRSKLFIKR